MLIDVSRRIRSMSFTPSQLWAAGDSALNPNIAAIEHALVRVQTPYFHSRNVNATMQAT
jgi:hypothetical protein